jgi:hypothetical protein
MKKLIFLLLLIVFPISAFALVSGVIEEDGSPSCFPWQLKVSNGTLTCNSDGSASITTGGGGGGSGDITDVGDCSTGACFTGSSGTTLTFSEIISDPAPPASTKINLYAMNRFGRTMLKRRASDGVILELNQDNVLVATNETGSTIGAFVPVYSSGTGSGGEPLVAPAKADSPTTMPAVGITLESISNGGNGLVMFDGVLSNVNTSGFSVNDVLYVSAATAGQFTTTEPAHPNLSQRIARVLSSSASGTAIVLGRSMRGDQLGTNNATWTFGATSAASAILANTSTAQRTFTYPDTSGTINVGTGSIQQPTFWSGVNTQAGMSGVNWDSIASSLTFGAATELDLSGMNWTKLPQAFNCDPGVVGGYCHDTANEGTLRYRGASQLNYLAGSSNKHTDVINSFGVSDGSEWFWTSIGTTIAASLSGGRSISMSGSPATTIDADDELYTDIKSFAIVNPTTGDSGIVQVKFATGATILRISCSTDTGTATIQFDERAEATPNTGGTDVMTSALACDNNTEATTSFTNAGIAADAVMNLDIDAVASNPTRLRVHIDFSKDD